MQIWCAGDEDGNEGIWKFVTKRETHYDFMGTNGETGLTLLGNTSIVLEGGGAVGEFYLVALKNNYQQPTIGTKMTHKGRTQ